METNKGQTLLHCTLSAAALPCCLLFPHYSTHNHTHTRISQSSVMSFTTSKAPTMFLPELCRRYNPFKWNGFQSKAQIAFQPGRGAHSSSMGFFCLLLPSADWGADWLVLLSHSIFSPYFLIVNVSSCTYFGGGGVGRWAGDVSCSHSLQPPHFCKSSRTPTGIFRHKPLNYIFATPYSMCSIKITHLIQKQVHLS